MQIGKRGRHEARFEISIEQRAHVPRQNEGSKKILIEPLAADQIEMFFADANRANRKQAEIFTDFNRVPDSITLSQAYEMLKKPPEPASVNKQRASSSQSALR